MRCRSWPTAYRRLGIDDLARSRTRSAPATPMSPDLVTTPVRRHRPRRHRRRRECPATPGDGSGSRWSTAAPAQAGRWEASVGVAGCHVGRRRLRRRHHGRDRQRRSASCWASGYHFTDRLRLGSTFTYDQKDYDAEVVGDDAGESFPIEGSLDTMSLHARRRVHFLTGPFTPYVVGGVGWAWVDTNIASEPPQIGCWWHPWYGYVCTGLAGHQDGRWPGLRGRPRHALRLQRRRWPPTAAYRMRWVDFENATGTPSFDTLQLNLVWKF